MKHSTNQRIQELDHAEATSIFKPLQTAEQPLRTLGLDRFFEIPVVPKQLAYKNDPHYQQKSDQTEVFHWQIFLAPNRLPCVDGDRDGILGVP